MKYFTDENVEKIASTIVIIGVIGIVYSIIAGIWGFAPTVNINWKIFATSIIITIIGIVIGNINDNNDYIFY